MIQQAGQEAGASASEGLASSERAPHAGAASGAGAPHAGAAAAVA